MISSEEIVCPVISHKGLELYHTVVTKVQGDGQAGMGGRFVPASYLIRMRYRYCTGAEQILSRP